MYYFVCDTVQDTFYSYFMEFTPIVYIHRHFCTTSSYWTHYHWTLPGSPRNRTVSGTVPKAQDNKPKKYQQQPLTVSPHQQQPLTVSPPQDVYLDENQARHTLVIRNDSLPTPASAK